MSATREQVEALFAAALEQPPERRVAYVAAVVEDPDVSAEVLALLAAHERRGRFDSVAHELRGLRSAAASVPLAQLVGWLRTVLVGRYSIERELGHGGMALVYLAHDLKHDRPVAIKVLRPELAAAVGAERFLREIQIAARLQHPNILPLYDSGEAGGTLYYVMPYVEGETLRERLTREGQLPLDDALKIAAEICDALEYAHGRDLVHRDVKPENILLARERCLVADFGIARAITAAGGEKLTETGIAVGTPAYMSPEQAAAEGRVDGRSDIYSLACVLYEMLAGEPPFSGPSAHAILARKLSDPVPRLRTVRETVSAGVERAIQKALAKVPADRFTTAAQFAEALGPSVVRRPRASSPRPLGWAAAAAVMVAVLAVLIPRAVSRTPVAPEPNVIAVAPFGVRGAGIGLWSEGLVEYLSRSLDGAGELRTVSPSVFLRRWSGRADPASARELGGRTGARLVVFGSLVQGARDSVRGRATLLDVVTGQSLAEVDVSGDTLAIDRMADSLGVSLLRELGRARPVAAVRNAPLGGASLPAIKEFLRGEQYYRRGHYDSALAHHARAVALDSSFALAYRRISLDLSWGPPTSGAFEPIGAYAFKAAALNRGLTMRESMLIAADSCFYAAFDASAPDHATLRHRLFTLLNEAARRFPGDPEVWQAIGEARFHHLFEAGYHHGGPPLQSFGTPSDVLQAFETAIALDPGFTPAYEHVFEVATISGHAHLAQRYARTYLTLNAADAHATSLRLAAQLLDPARSTSPEIARLIDTLAAGPLLYAAFRLGAWPDSAETAVRLLRALPNGRRSVAGIMPVWADTLMWPQYLATSLLYRGHLREAHKLYRPLISRPNPNRWAWFRNPLLDLALLNAVPTDTAVARIARSLEPDVLASRGFWPPHWLPWWFARRDTAELHRIIQQTDRTARRTTRPLERWRASYLQTAAAGYLALLRGDSLAAVRHFDALPDTTCSWIECSLDKLTLARLLAARGEDRRASELLDQWLWNAPSPFFVLARLERARIAERVGDRDLASRWYQFVADAWRHADPELQSYVDEARQGVRRLGGEPRP